jgi:hypothetical protein
MTILLLLCDAKQLRDRPSTPQTSRRSSLETDSVSELDSISIYSQADAVAIGRVTSCRSLGMGCHQIGLLVLDQAER